MARCFRLRRKRFVTSWCFFAWIAAMYILTFWWDWTGDFGNQTKDLPVFQRRSNRTSVQVFSHSVTSLATHSRNHVDVTDTVLQYELSRRKVDRVWLEFWRYIHNRLRQLAQLPGIDKTFTEKIENVISTTAEYIREPMTSSMGLRRNIAWTEERQSRVDAWQSVMDLMTSVKTADNSKGIVTSFVDTVLNNSETMPSLLEDNYRILEGRTGLDESARQRRLDTLGRLVQRRLNYLQSPKDCSKTSQLICLASKLCGTGFGCQLNHFTGCLIAGYATNRTVIVDQLQGNNAWNKYLKPFSSPCQKRPIQADLDSLTQNRGKDVLRYGMKKTPLEFAPFAVPEDLHKELVGVHGDPAAWWIGQILKYITRPGSEHLNGLDTFMNESGLMHPYVGLHVRRTDKVLREAKLHHLKEYLSHATDWFNAYQYNNEHGSSKKVVRRVLLATDDPIVIEEALNNYASEYTWIHDKDATRSAKNPNTRLGDGPILGIIKDILLLSRADYLVCTFSSNVCRAAYALMQTRNTDMSARFKSLDDIFYYQGQNPHFVKAVTAHTPEGDDELSLQINDTLTILGNHWNGYSKGVHSRTGKKGLYPSYKVKDISRPVAMPLYSEIGR